MRQRSDAGIASHIDPELEDYDPDNLDDLDVDDASRAANVLFLHRSLDSVPEDQPMALPPTSAPPFHDSTVEVDDEWANLVRVLPSDTSVGRPPCYLQNSFLVMKTNTGLSVPSTTSPTRSLALQPHLHTSTV